MLRVTASSDEFNAIGTFARDVTDLDETPRTSSQATFDVVSGDPDPLVAQCSEDEIYLNEIIDSTASDADKVVLLKKFAANYFQYHCGRAFVPS